MAGPTRRRARPTPVRARRPGLVTLAVLGLLAWAASMFAPAVPVWGIGTLIVSAVALLPLVSVVAIPVLGVAARQRRWIAFGAAALAALSPWALVLGYAIPGGVAAGNTTAPVRMMLISAYAGRVDPGAVVAAVRAQHPDLLVITELTVTLSHDLTMAGLDQDLTARFVQLPQAQTPDGEDAGIGVWSSLPVDDATAITGTRWPAMTGLVHPADGAPFTLVAGHAAPPLSAGAAAWNADLVALRAACAAAPGDVVLLGTLNATPWHKQLRDFGQVHLTDAAELLGRGLRPTWPTWSLVPLLPLDHAMVSPAITVLTLDAPVIGGSDHRALLVSVQPAAAPRSAP